MRYYLLFFLFTSFSIAKAQSISEELSWYFIYPETGDTIDIGSKGSVQRALWKNGFLPDPFVDSNDRAYAHLEEQLWVLKANFRADQFLKKEHVVLKLAEIDTYAEVLVNGDPVLKTENAFVNYDVDISRSLVSGVNEVELRIVPPVLYHQEKYNNEAYHLPSPNDNHAISIASRVRKPQFQFGWDWVPRMNTIGVNGGVSLIGFDDVFVEDPIVFTQLQENNVGKVQYAFKVRGDSTNELTIRSRLFGKLNGEFKNGSIICSAEKTSPYLWSPIGLGYQYVYTDQLNIYNVKGQLVNVFYVKFGFREVELVQQQDEWGESYFFKVNGDRIFAKGANVIPMDVFLTDITPEEEVGLVEEMVRSNFNMVRVWGGGTYASEAFLNACDSLGIMVWHDMMFACSMYPGDSAFLQNVFTEFKQQLLRILSHPCVVQINGNNEVDVAWKNWGFQDTYQLDDLAQSEIQLAYERLFKQLIPEVMNSFPGIPYSHTSPLSNWGKLSDFNYGSQHYWGLWHGNDDLNEAFLKVGRFNSEYGFQSFPSLQLLQKYSSNELRDISSPVLMYKQRSYVGNDKIVEKIEPLYGPVKGLEDLIYKSQLFQAYALETYILAHRRNADRCGGTLYWQFNDVFPGPTWSTIDFDGNYKAAHYKVQSCFEDVLVHWLNDSLFISNLTGEKVELQVNYEWLDLTGRVKESGVIENSLLPQGFAALELKPHKKSGVKKDRVLKLTYSKGVPEQKMSLFVRKKGSFILNGAAVIMKCELLNKTEGYLEVRVDEFSEKTWIQCKVEGVHLKENFNDLLPGTYKVPFRYKTKPELKDFHIYRN